jgi:tetratricopeptide (TPR) repeat protein
MMNSMRKIVWVLVVLAGLLEAGCRKTPVVNQEAQDATDAQSAITKVQQADVLYDQREDISRVREALALLRLAEVADSDSYDVAWRLSKFNYYLAAHTTDEDERYKGYRDGVAAGERAVTLQPGKPEGHFWRGANMGGNARDSSLAGLTDIDDIREEMETVIRIDEGFQGGSAYLALGQLYLEAPRLLGGDVAKAVELLEKGKRFGPTNAMMRLRLAEAFHAQKRDADARKSLTEMFAMTPAKGFEPEYKEAIDEGHKLWDKLNGQSR